MRNMLLIAGPELSFDHMHVHVVQAMPMPITLSILSITGQHTRGAA